MHSAIMGCKLRLAEANSSTVIDIGGPQLLLHR
jgi:hypothetical protein